MTDVGDATITFSGQGIQQVNSTINVGGDLNITQGSQGFTGINKSDRKEERFQFLQQLYKSPYEDRKNRNPIRAEGTCEWFTSHDLFQNWKEKKSGLLWVSADPGCGKSVLSRHLVDDIVSSDRPAPADGLHPTDRTAPPDSRRATCYFFFKDDFEDQKTLESAISCLLHQLFTQKPAFLTDKFLDDFAEQGNQLFSSFHKLWGMLIAAATSDVKGEIICVLDALDECSNQSHLSTALTRLYGNGYGVSSLKFLVTSRPYLRIQQDFQELKTSQPTIHLSGDSPEEVNKIEGEIGIVIKQRTEELAKKLRLDDIEKQELETELASIRHRTYLWVHLVFSHLDRAVRLNRTTLLHSIHDMPRTVEEAYDKILQKSDHPQHARKILHVIVAADRPLHLTEMAVVLALETHHKTHAEVQKACLDPDDLSVEIREACGLFVAIQDSKVFLLHQTAKEFLVHLPNTPLNSRNPSLRWQHSFITAQSHHLLATVCMQYLLLDEFNEADVHACTPKNNESENNDTENVDSSTAQPCYMCDPQVFPMLKYAAANWAAHYNQARDTPTASSLEPSALQLCSATTYACSNWLLVYGREKRDEEDFYTELKTSLLIASHFGFERMVRLALQDKSRKEELAEAGDPSGRTALSWACENGNKVIVNLLLGKVSKFKVLLKDWSSSPTIVNLPDAENRTPLWYATVNGHVDIVELLLKRGAKQEMIEGDERQTPLAWAASHDRRDILSLLLEYGGSHNSSILESKDRRDETPLISSVTCGNEDVALMLLNNGAKVDAVDVCNRTSLFYACGRGYMSIVQLLLDRGAHVNGDKGGSNTPLMIASMNGHKDIVQLLLKKGASSQSANLDGRTALILASQHGYRDIMLLILNNGAFLDALDRDHRTALIYSCEKGYMDCAQLLIERGADVNITPRIGMKALSCATLSRKRELVRLLLEYGADVDSTDGAGDTALTLASGMGERDIAELLLDWGAQVDVCDRSGMPPLVYASVTGQKDIVELLLERGAETDEYTMLLAADRGHWDIEKLLRDHDTRHDSMLSPLPPPTCSE